MRVNLAFYNPSFISSLVCSPSTCPVSKQSTHTHPSPSPSYHPLSSSPSSSLSSLSIASSSSLHTNNKNTTHLIYIPHTHSCPFLPSYLYPSYLSTYLIKITARSAMRKPDCGGGGGAAKGGGVLGVAGGNNAAVVGLLYVH